MFVLVLEKNDFNYQKNIEKFMILLREIFQRKFEGCILFMSFLHASLLSLYDLKYLFNNLDFC